MAHDDRLEASDSGGPQRRGDGPDPERRQVETSGVEDHRDVPVPQDVAGTVADIKHDPLEGRLVPMANRRPGNAGPSDRQQAKGGAAHRPEPASAPRDGGDADDRRPSPADSTDLEIRYLPSRWQFGDPEQSAREVNPRVSERHGKRFMNARHRGDRETARDGEPTKGYRDDRQWKPQPGHLAEVHDREGSHDEPDRDR